jgi:transcriptional regulator with XRE-family HTH domain
MASTSWSLKERLPESFWLTVEGSRSNARATSTLLMALLARSSSSRNCRTSGNVNDHLTYSQVTIWHRTLCPAAKATENRATLAWKDVGAPRLNALLKQRGLTNQQVADILGVDQSFISKFRNGRRVPDADQLALMVNAAGGSVDDVLAMKPGGRRVRSSGGAVPRHLVARLLRDVERLTAAASEVREASGSWKRK